MNSAKDPLDKVLEDGNLTAAESSSLFVWQYGDGLDLLFWGGVLLCLFAYFEAIKNRNKFWFIVGLIITFITFTYDAMVTRYIFK